MDWCGYLGGKLRPSCCNPIGEQVHYGSAPWVSHAQHCFRDWEAVGGAADYRLSNRCRHGW